ncbi:MAG TPA: Ni/Fe-hydrogenase, b-type cytochrome subunit [Thermoanaerobaculia bacterium]|nr:Ni/Fe-hydrogenase, b-type cytochrome subunit [Thermoanaerobaculia bacterium]
MTSTAQTAGRRAADPLARDAAMVERVYVWDALVRTTHWAIALSIFVLSFTGLYIGRPFLIVDPLGGRFVMGTVKAVHSWTAIVFALAVLARIAWMFLGPGYARWSHFFPASRERWRGVWETFRFYLFVRRDEPGYTGHNPLAGLAYIAVFGLYLLEIATGLGMYALSADVGSWPRAFAFLVPLLGGTQTARWLHHVGMWLLLGFFAHHLFSALLMARVERNGTMESIFSGYKFVHRAARPKR